MGILKMPGKRKQPSGGDFTTVSKKMIRKKVLGLEDEIIKKKSRIIDLENENATLKTEADKLAMSSSNFKDLITERDDLKVRLENEKIENGELAEIIKRLQMKVQELDRNKAIELKRDREKHISRINELEEDNLLLVKDMKAKETDYNFQIKHLNNEIEDAKNSLIKKDNEIKKEINMKENIIKESESVNAKYRKYKENLK